MSITSEKCMFWLLWVSIVSTGMTSCTWELSVDTYCKNSLQDFVNSVLMKKNSIFVLCEFIFIHIYLFFI